MPGRNRPSKGHRRACVRWREIADHKTHEAHANAGRNVWDKEHILQSCRARASRQVTLQYQCCSIESRPACDGSRAHRTILQRMSRSRANESGSNGNGESRRSIKAHKELHCEQRLQGTGTHLQSAGGIDDGVRSVGHVGRHDDFGGALERGSQDRERC